MISIVLSVSSLLRGSSMSLNPIASSMEQPMINPNVLFDEKLCAWLKFVTITEHLFLRKNKKIK